MIENLLLHLVAAVESEHDRKVFIRLAFAQAIENEGHIVAGLFDEAEAEQRVNGEGGVADPGESV